MKHVINILSLLVCLVAALPIAAQGHLKESYEAATKLFEEQEYMKAAQMFASVQQEALASDSIDDYIKSLTSEGECYYALDLVKELKLTLDNARKAYNTYAGDVSNSLRLIWLEAITKLEGSYYYCMTDIDPSAFQKAEDAYNRCYQIIHASGSENNIARYHVDNELLSLYYKQGEYEKALEKAESVYRFCKDNPPKPLSPKIDHNEEFRKACAARAMVLARLNMFENALAYISHCDDNPRYLRYKGKIHMLRYDYDGTDNIAEAKFCYEQYFYNTKKSLTSEFNKMTEAQREQHWLAMHQFVTDCYRLENADAGFLYDVALFCKSCLIDFSKNKALDVPTWPSIQKNLKTGECAIEFIQYEKKGRQQMGALVLKETGTPLFVKIGGIDSIQNIPLKNGGYVKYAIETDNARLKDNLYSDSAVFYAIWTPELLSAVGHDVTKLYFAPDGLFHQLAIEYMLPSDSCLSLSSICLYRLTSTRQISKTSTKKNVNQVLLCGGIDYNKASSSSIEYGSVLTNDSSAYNYLKSLHATMKDLPNTRIETDSINAILCRMGITTKIVSDSMATESYFSYMAEHFPMVHLATHGYYNSSIRKGTDLKPAIYDESLSQSGLVLAGINSSLSSSRFDVSKQDGILSAKELSAMNLQNVDLIVLSACQTGLGYLTADGVFGLQRGLKNAGVKGMIVSLWSVDDVATSLLMQAFYKNLQSADIHTAFIKAREELRNQKYMSGRNFNPARLSSVQEAQTYNQPQFYNSFILIDVN